MTVVGRLRVEYAQGRALGIGTPAPRLSWITETDVPGWAQAAYELELDGAALGRVESDESVFVPWPSTPLCSREKRVVRVRVWGADGPMTPWSDAVEVEAGLLEVGDWSASWITPAEDEEGRPQHLRRPFEVTKPVAHARLYATSAGINQLHLNGQVVGDTVFAPGWTAYGKRLHYETHDVTALVREGLNVLGAVVADGWWRGHLTWEMKRNVYGDRLGLVAQLELTYADGTTSTVVSDPGWRSAPGPILVSDFYNGETYDARLELHGWATSDFDDSGWQDVATFEPEVGALVAPLGPPVRRTEEVAVREVLTTPSGRTILDFGQNLVGWVRLTVDGPTGTTLVLRHAEVLEERELGTRPLRAAEATDRYVLGGGGPETWEPAFTFHGFRYVEVTGWPGELDPGAFTAIVIHSDFERTGSFECSHELLNQLHRNVEWGMRGNFVDVPTDCPQRDERLGWTGDLQVFAPTATFLYGVDGFLADWLEDVKANQRADGAVPMVVPSEPFGADPFYFVPAAWGDAATIVPWVLYERYGDRGRLAEQFDSMRAWVDFARAKAGDAMLWPEEFQLGDWLDPDAPPEQPWKAKTDAVLVASAYFARSAQIVSDAAAVLGQDELALEYGNLARRVREAFRHEFVTPSGRISSDAATAYALAIVFDLYETPADRVHGGARLATLAEKVQYRIATGFVGTPLVLPALSAVGDERTAYRLLTETGCPSWLYSVTMGATTVWERWDSMLPDGTINPGEMTSFNHYALGGVADWMHRTIGGLAPAAPGYRRLLVAPVPGRGVSSASCALRTPYGHASCRWALEGATFRLAVDVPPSCTATVVLPGADGESLEVASGTHEWSYDVSEATVEAWADAATSPLDS